MEARRPVVGGERNTEVFAEEARTLAGAQTRFEKKREGERTHRGRRGCPEGGRRRKQAAGRATRCNGVGRSSGLAFQERETQ